MSLAKTTFYTSELYDDLQKTSNYKNNFTYEGANALQAYLEDLANECDINIEYDPIAFCCEYSEYENYQEIYKAYSNTFNNVDECIKKIHEYSQVIEFDGGIIIADF